MKLKTAASIIPRMMPIILSEKKIYHCCIISTALVYTPRLPSTPSSSMIAAEIVAPAYPSAFALSSCAIRFTP